MGRFFSAEEVKRLYRTISAFGISDTEFDTTDIVTSDDLVAIVQGGKNKKISIRVFNDKLIEDVKSYVDEKDNIIYKSLYELSLNTDKKFKDLSDFATEEDIDELLNNLK